MCCTKVSVQHSSHLRLAYSLRQTQRCRSCRGWLLSWNTFLPSDDPPPPWRPSLGRCCVGGHPLRSQSCWWSAGTDQGCSHCRGGPCPGHHWCRTLCNAFYLQWSKIWFDKMTAKQIYRKHFFWALRKRDLATVLQFQLKKKTNWICLYWKKDISQVIHLNFSGLRSVLLSTIGPHPNCNYCQY